MNHSIVRYVVGRVLGIFALLLLLPLGVALYYHEPNHALLAWILASGFSAALFLIFGLHAPKNTTFYAREGMVICAILWLLLSAIGGLPLYLSGAYPTLVDGFFEITSGLTTTGASVATSVSSLPHSVLFWRSFTHLIGGMGVLVLFLALLPNASSSSVQIAKAEMPGPVFGKVTAKLSDTARLLYGIYFGMTAILIIALLLAGMPLFDAVTHAFGTAGTGGFGTHNNSVAYFHSPAIDWILTIAILAFGTNMSLYYFVLIGKVRRLLKDEEFRWYIGIIFVMILLICINIFPLYQKLGKSIEETIRDASFSLASILSTTGFTTVNYDTWPLFARGLLLFAMLIGGSGGSTAGGFKVSRIIVTIKTALRTLAEIRHPRRIVPMHLNGEPIPKKTTLRLHGYLGMYLLLMLALFLIVSLDPIVDSMETAVSAVFATFNNVGPGLGSVVGPVGNYFDFQPFTKMILSLGMIAGRLEIWPLLILFAPQTWRRQ